MSNKWIILILTLLNTLPAQTNPFEGNTGYINISADTIGVPIFIDGSLIGHSPLENPIPVLPGFHHITHHPPSIQDPFIQYAQTKDVKQIYVMGGDTVIVHLETYLLAQQLSQIKKEYHLKNYIGISMSFLLLWQLWIIAN
ncbi:MAG: hypothetical protein P8M59_01075 [Candidatus Marinimicrobia bacterium]|nr:hypothetical protein [Candidatus Neomarinimicrobiota bacterium]